MTSLTTEKHLAAAGGNPTAQLRHLRAHRASQPQEKFENARIDWKTVIWKTVISRSQSRRHIARHLHAKINLKAGGLQPAGRMNTPEAQKSIAHLTTKPPRPGRFMEI